MKTFLLIASMVALAVAGPTRTFVIPISADIVSPGDARLAPIIIDSDSIVVIPPTNDEFQTDIVEPTAAGRCGSVVGSAAISTIVINIHGSGHHVSTYPETETIHIADVAPEPVELPQPVLPEPVVVGTPIIPALAVKVP